MDSNGTVSNDEDTPHKARDNRLLVYIIRTKEKAARYRVAFNEAPPEALSFVKIGKTERVIYILVAT